MTLPLIHLLQQPGHRGSDIVREIIASRTANNEQWSELLSLLGDHRSIEYASRRAVEYAERAKKQLAAFPRSSEREALLALPDYVLSRDR
jgi:octaprenyl-diphosphate synthase